MHYIPMIDGGIAAGEKPGTYPPFDEGLREGLLVKESASDLPFLGKVWNPVNTAWPDFTHPKTADYYLRLLQNMHEQFAFDGLWIVGPIYWKYARYFSLTEKKTLTKFFFLGYE